MRGNLFSTIIFINTCLILLVMKIRDRIWGTTEIKEPVLQNLLAHPDVCRLKKISQFGLPFKYYPLSGFDRYEHSVGVMMLVRSLGASLEEQVASLLHDVSHTSFSHIVDWVVGNRRQEDFQDNRHLEYLTRASLASVLTEHSLSPQRLADHHNYSLLESPAPDLCADRIDYAIREFKDWAAPDAVAQCINNLIVCNGSIVFNTKSSALLFGRSYMKLQREHWGGAEWMLRWQIFSEVLKYALENKSLSMNDLVSTSDDIILENLESSREPYIENRLALLLTHPIASVCQISEADYHLHKKFRYIDPLYCEQGRINLLSDCDNGYRTHLAEEREYNKRGLFVSILEKSHKA